MKSIITLFVAISISITACNSSKKKVEEKTNTTPLVKQLVFDKLTGTWQNEEGKNFEQWVKNSDNTYHSVAFSIKGPDTSWNEKAKIYPESSRWVFENTVTGQNEGKAIKFTSTILTENTVQFSNPAHDFPTDINYTVLDNNTISAFIVGPNNKGGKDTIPFNYTRVK